MEGAHYSCRATPRQLATVTGNYDEENSYLLARGCDDRRRLAATAMDASAQWRGRGWGGGWHGGGWRGGGWGPGIATGVVGGSLIAGAIIASRPPGYIVYPSYAQPVYGPGQTQSLESYHLGSAFLSSFKPRFPAPAPNLAGRRATTVGGRMESQNETGCVNASNRARFSVRRRGARLGVQGTNEPPAPPTLGRLPGSSAGELRKACVAAFHIAASGLPFLKARTNG